VWLAVLGAEIPKNISRKERKGRQARSRKLEEGIHGQIDGEFLGQQKSL
jgi:hypothetical protein